MRTFTDSLGRTWEAATAFGSYGAVRLIFSRRGDTELRACGMPAETLHAAEQMLAACPDATLVSWLATAEPWQ
ncbi:MAG TPA: hypothetical protein VFM15_00825 [Gammaproteobacteria bacterium]|nr:hypothetical protein [Gammaproteobacteria bacterium]